MMITGTTALITFLGTKAIPEALKALQQAYATHPAAVSDIRHLINQNHLQDAAHAMENLAPQCASTVASALRTAARHLLS